MARPPLTLIAYGSLMSGFGLAHLGTLPVVAARPVRLHNCRRGFGKVSQYGDRLAMILEPVRANEPIGASYVDESRDERDGIDALALTISLDDFTRVAVREGYLADAIQTLAARARAAGQSVAEYLWQQLVANHFDRARYRRALFAAVEYTSPHYIPHPVALTGTEPALTFLAPGLEGSGSDGVTPVRVATGVTDCLSAVEAWRRKPNASQLDYFAMCLLAEVHHISLADVTNGLDAEPVLIERLRERLDRERGNEHARFRTALCLSEAAYTNAFTQAA
ncbi:MAG: hypothetical protein HYR72_03355 [Deltaproteobacteria bacterium]|nr:hypothetical protein [Deltaproteobacteria bacterium]MBI3388989.1 hypothetical protein [Deltaproteobacteria bacterium]